MNQSNKIYELIFVHEDAEFSNHVALSFDKDKLQALIHKVKAVDDEYNAVCDSDEPLEDWQLPDDYPLNMIKGFDAVDWCMYEGEYANYAEQLEIHERTII